MSRHRGRNRECVASMYRDGLSLCEIGERLAISPKTVSAYVSQLGIAERRQARHGKVNNILPARHGLTMLENPKVFDRIRCRRCDVDGKCIRAVMAGGAELCAKKKGK